MKCYKEKLKLKKWVKVVSVVTLLQIITIAILNYAADRFDQINDGTITIISENEMIERN